MIREGAYTNLQRANIEYDYEHGVPIKEIMGRYGLSKKGLYKAFHRFDIIDGRRTKYKYNKVITALKYGGLTTKEVAQKFGISRSTIYYICKKYNYNLKWRVVRLTPERRAKLLAEGFNWRNQNRLIYRRKNNGT